MFVLRKHVETQGEGITISLRQEIVTKLADIQDLTLQHLRGIVTKIVKVQLSCFTTHMLMTSQISLNTFFCFCLQKHLQVYFRAKKQEFVIIDVVKKMLSHLENCDDVRKVRWTWTIWTLVPFPVSK